MSAISQMHDSLCRENIFRVWHTFCAIVENRYFSFSRLMSEKIFDFVFFLWRNKSRICSQCVKPQSLLFEDIGHWISYPLILESNWMIIEIVFKRRRRKRKEKEFWVVDTRRRVQFRAAIG